MDVIRKELLSDIGQKIMLMLLLLMMMMINTGINKIHPHVLVLKFKFRILLFELPCKENEGHVSKCRQEKKIQLKHVNNKQAKESFKNESKVLEIFFWKHQF